MGGVWQHLLWPVLALLPDAPDPVSKRVRIPPRTLARYGTLLGLGMIAVAWLWAGVLRGRHLDAWFPARHWWLDLALGTLIGGVFVLIAWWLIDRVPPLKRIETLLVSALDMQALGFHHALFLGLIAGIPEEILFRGAMQPAWGWIVTSLIFGALHAITPAYFVYAATAGGLLGGLTIWREGLWTPIAAHVVIDALMFTLLIRKWRRTQYDHAA
jgi:membrane protease YdiL (CAAX protease family)